MLLIILISFFSGILTVLAPCVLPLLPVILGGSLAGQSKIRPYIIIASLVVSLLIFTLLLKVSTVLIHIDPMVWEYIAGGLLILFSVTLIFPQVWTWLMGITGIERLSQNSLEQASKKEGIWGPIALGAALGPVFSSCNPTYTVLLATILPASLTMGLIGLLAYFIGLGIILLLIVHFGRSIIGRFKFFTNPRGIFRRVLGVIILIVGLLIITGYMKKIEVYVIEKNIFVNTLELDSALNNIILKYHNNRGGMCANGKCDEGKENRLMMDIAEAPELVGIASWINLPAGQAGSNPLTIEGLRGKVVLIDFWTYSCINCIRTQPYLNAWHEKYADDGLVIIGVHAPEFSFEKIERNVREASQKAGIRYPIALDNDFKTWNAYGNRYWPAKYLIDQEGNIVYKHFGEGAYEETEGKIKSLLTSFLKEDGKTEGKKEDFINNKSSVTSNAGQLLQEGAYQKTPETYLGSDRAENMIGAGTDGDYQADWKLGAGEWTLFGPWKVMPEYIESLQIKDTKQQLPFRGGILGLNFSARQVFLVVSSEGKAGNIEVQEKNKDGTIHTVSNVIISKDDIYTIFSSDTFETNRIILLSVGPGLRLHAFTFGD